MDYHSLTRRQLQSLCKKHGIPANSTNADMADALSALLNKESAKKSEKRATRSRETSSIAVMKEVKGSASVDSKDLAKSVRQKDEAAPSERRTRACEIASPNSQKEEAIASDRRPRAREVASQDSQTEEAAVSDRRTRAREVSALDSQRSAKKDPIKQVASTDHSHTRAVKRTTGKTIRVGGVPLRRGKIKVRSPGRSPKRVDESSSLHVEVEASSTVLEEEAGCLVHEQKNVEEEAECPLNVQDDAKEDAKCLVNVQENAKEVAGVHGVDDQVVVMSEQSNDNLVHNREANEEPEQEAQARKKKGRVTFSDTVNFKEASSFSSAVKFTPVSSTGERRTRSSKRETTEEDIMEVREAGRSLRSLRLTTPVTEKRSSSKNMTRKVSVKVEADKIHVNAANRKLKDRKDSNEETCQVIPRSSTRKGARKGPVDASGQDGESLLAPIGDDTPTREAIVTKALKSEQKGTEIEKEKDPAGMEATVELLDSRGVRRNASSRLDYGTAPSVGGSVSRTRSTVARGKVSSITQDRLAESLRNSTVGRQTRRSKAIMTATMVDEQKVSAECTKDMFVRTADEREGEDYIDRQLSELPEEAQTSKVVLGSSEGRDTSQSGLPYLGSSGKEMNDAEEENEVLDERSTSADDHDSPEEAMQNEEEKKSTDVTTEVNLADGNLLVADGKVAPLESEEKFSFEDNHDPSEEVMQNDEENKSIDVIKEANSSEGNILVADGNVVSLGSEENFSLEDNHDPSEEVMQNQEENKCTDVIKEANSAEGNILVAEGKVVTLGSEEKFSLEDKMQEEQGLAKSTNSSSGFDKAEGNLSDLVGSSVSLEAAVKSTLEDQMEKNEETEEVNPTSKVCEAAVTSTLEDQMEKNEETEEVNPTNKVCEIDTSRAEYSFSDLEDNAISLKAAEKSSLEDQMEKNEETEEVNARHKVCEVDTSECNHLEGDEASVKGEERESNEFKSIDDVETAEPITLIRINSGENSGPLPTASRTGKVTGIADERKRENDQFRQSANQFEGLREPKTGVMEAEHKQMDCKLNMCVRDKEEATIQNSGIADVMDGCLAGGFCEIAEHQNSDIMDGRLTRGFCEIMEQPVAPALDQNRNSATNDGEKEHRSLRGLDCLITADEGLTENYCARGRHMEGNREQPGTPCLDHGICEKEESCSPAVFTRKVNKDTSALDDEEESSTAKDTLCCEDLSSEAVLGCHDFPESGEEEKSMGTDLKAAMVNVDETGRDDDVRRSEEAACPSVHDALDGTETVEIPVDSNSLAYDGLNSSAYVDDRAGVCLTECLVEKSRAREDVGSTGSSEGQLSLKPATEISPFESSRVAEFDSKQRQVKTVAAESYESEANENIFTVPGSGAKSTVSTHVDTIMAGFVREKSMQEIDYTLMSLRKLKQMCKKGREAAMMCKENKEAAKKDIKAIHPGEVPSDIKRAALKTLTSNISVDSPNAKAPSPRPKNPLAVYEVNGGLTAAVSPLAPNSSYRKPAILHHHR